MTTRLTLLSAAMLACWSGLLPSYAAAELMAEFPDEMAETVAEAADRCRKTDGTPDVANVLQSDDLNGDGRPDWIADYGKLICKNGSNPACSENGCLLQIYYWSAGDWDKVFEDFVKSYKFSTSGKSRMMHVTTYGLPCNRPKEETCNYTYRLEEEALTPVR
ncbi:MAG: hypothetical protein P8Y82_09505 [Methyloceanibacter sp.]